MARGDLSDLHTELVDLLVSGEVAAIVRRLMQDPVQLAKAASRSYVHPNGFRKLVIALRKNGATLRIHHWSLSDTSASNVHNHRWPFASAIIAGRVRSAQYTLADGGDAVERYRFEPSRAGGQYALTPAGKGRISVSSIAEFSSGSTYALDVEQLHQVRCDRDTLSLVLSGPAERDHTDVFRPASLGPQSRDLPLLPVSDIRHSLALVAAKLQIWTTGCGGSRRT